jgi:PAS domain S-box-containing protein
MDKKSAFRNPADDAVSNIQFSDIFILQDIQRLQDLFSDANGVASIITHPDGTPITKPSNFCRLCIDIIRNTEKGLNNCFKSDAVLGRHNSSGPVVQPCLSGGLWDAGASITVGGKHIANWLIGQVRNKDLNEGHLIQYADEIGADRDDFMMALGEVPVMSFEQFNKVSEMLFAFVKELSEKAFNNLQLKSQIVKRTRAEESLNFQQYLMQALMDNIPDHIYFKDLESRFIRMSNAQAQKFGLTDPAQAVGKSDFDFFSKEHARQAFQDEQEIIHTGKPINIEEKETWTDSSDTWVATSKMPLYDKNGKIIGTFGISVNITEHKQAEEKIKETNKKLEKLNSEKDKLFSIIAHDLKSPFHGLIGLTEVMAAGCDEMSSAEISKYSTSLHESIVSLYTLLENLLEWAQLQKGAIGFIPQSLNLSDNFSQCIDSLKQRASQKGISIINEIPESQIIYADEKMVNSVLRNLLTNAVKFTRRGGKVVGNAREIEDGLVEISVSDTGIGIPVEIIGKLFKLGEKVSTTGTENEPSTGLGLLLCKEFVEKHGGTIRVESIMGNGSTFFFTLPVTQLQNQIS